MTDIAIEFSKGSFDRLRRSAQARSRVLNEDMRVTLKKTSLKVLVALRASTRKSPKKRQLYEAGEMSMSDRFRHTRMQDKIQDWYKQHGAPKTKSGRHLPTSVYTSKAQRNEDFKFAAIKQRYPGEHKLLPIFGAEKKAEAKKSKKLTIKKQGLARSSFTWMMGALGSGGSAQQPEISGVTSVTKGATQAEGSTRLSVKMSNRLKYVLSALKGGKRDVSTALDRAREMLMSDTRRALKKAVRK
jgi:hypothetical protein